MALWQLCVAVWGGGDSKHTRELCPSKGLHGANHLFRPRGGAVASWAAEGQM